jgi:hypothetical protein
MDVFTKAQVFLYHLKEGKGYKTSVDTKVVCVKRTKKKIYLSNGVVVHLKEKNGMLYFSTASIVRGYKRYEILNQILRDIEGYLIYKLHTKGANVLTLS